MTTLAFTILVGQAMLRKAGRHGNFLRTVRVIGDDAAADRAAELLAPQLLAVRRRRARRSCRRYRRRTRRRRPSASCRRRSGSWTSGATSRRRCRRRRRKPIRPSDRRRRPFCRTSRTDSMSPSPAHGCPTFTDRSSLTFFGVTVSHQSTSPTRMRLVCGS